MSRRKPNSFEFKKFVVFQDLCAMKVGTDGVLLGAWTFVREDDVKILDIGTGTGLIALMLAQKTKMVNILAIDVEQDAVVQAQQNISQSLFSDQIEVSHLSLQEMKDWNTFDLIVSNPPFFIDSLLSPNQKRVLARHTEALPLSDLLSKSYNLLKVGGRLSFIYPFQYESLVASMAKKQGFGLSRKTVVYPTPTSPPKRILWELVKGDLTNFTEDSIVIELDRHVYSVEYRNLTKDYYLKS